MPKTATHASFPVVTYLSEPLACAVLLCGCSAGAPQIRSKAGQQLRNTPTSCGHTTPSLVSDYCVTLLCSGFERRFGQNRQGSSWTQQQSLGHSLKPAHKFSKLSCRHSIGLHTSDSPSSVPSTILQQSLQDTLAGPCALQCPQDSPAGHG